MTGVGSGFIPRLTKYSRCYAISLASAWAWRYLPSRRPHLPGKEYRLYALLRSCACSVLQRNWNGFTLIVHLSIRARTAASFAIIVGLLSIPVCARGAPQEPEYDLDIPRLGVTEALAKFSDQTQLQYGYLPESEAEERILVGPLKCRCTVQQAMDRLLPSGFSFGWINDNSILIHSPQPAPTDVARYTTARGILERVLVTDSRLWSLELDLPSLVVFERDDIAALGASTVPELLEYLPQQPYLRSAGFRNAGEQYADLRGLGPDMTLILINGRRVSASATSFDSNAFDLNAIPLSAVERVEVLLDSMSVTAGADAIGGIINLVLKQQFGRPQLELGYGSASGGAAELRGSLAADHTTESLQIGRAHV